MKQLAVLVVFALGGGCKTTQGGERAPTPGSAGSGTEGAASDTACATETSQLRTWIASVMAKSQRVVAPWPTGDAAFDAELAKLSAGAPKPGAPRLAFEQTVEIRLDSELASCPAWEAELRKAQSVTRREDL
jgi:hypothetical protein